MPPSPAGRHRRRGSRPDRLASAGEPAGQFSVIRPRCQAGWPPPGGTTAGSCSPGAGFRGRACVRLTTRMARTVRYLIPVFTTS